MSKCAATKNGVQCGGAATILDAERSRKAFAAGYHKAVYICLSCARREHPDLFPPPPEQLDMLNLFGEAARKSRKSQPPYVPLNAPLPGGSREA